VATYHRVAWFPEPGPGVYVREIAVSFDADEAAAIGVWEGVGYHNHGGRFSAQEVLEEFDAWLEEPAMVWLRPWLEMLARGEFDGARGLLEVYRARRGADAQTLEW
jgi:hypothetical protein